MIVIVAVPVRPDALVAVTVYTVVGDAAVGVPLIVPFAAIDKPAGKVGLTDVLVKGPPAVIVGTNAVIVVPTGYNCGEA